MTKPKKPKERKPGRKLQKPYKRNQPVKSGLCTKCGGVNGAHYLTCPTLEGREK